MTIQDLQQAILQEPEKCIISSDASDLARTLASIHDTLHRYDLRVGLRSLILDGFHLSSISKQAGIYQGIGSLTEEVVRGTAQLKQFHRSGYPIASLQEELDKLSPEGYSFKTEGNEVGWFADLEPVTLQHVRTWMHNQVPSKRYNKASATDALYLLDTLLRWDAVPQKYIDYMQILVDSHKEGDGL